MNRVFASALGNYVAQAVPEAMGALGEIEAPGLDTELAYDEEAPEEVPEEMPEEMPEEVPEEVPEEMPEEVEAPEEDLGEDAEVEEPPPIDVEDCPQDLDGEEGGEDGEDDVEEGYPDDGSDGRRPNRPHRRPDRPPHQHHMDDDDDDTPVFTTTINSPITLIGNQEAPVAIVPLPHFGRDPAVLANCPFCKNTNVPTRTETNPSWMTIVLCICILVAFWPLCWIPLCFLPIQTTHHRCTTCGNKVGEANHYCCRG